MDERKKVTIIDLLKKKENGQKIVRMAAYDYPTARLIDEAGLDIILVGDSLGMNVLGFEDTLSVTMDMMKLFTVAVRRGSPHCFVVADMPFGSYFTKELALNNAAELIRVGADAVKLEGGREVCEIVSAMTNAGIIVNGHIGLTPQSYKKLGGFKVQGKDPKRAIQLVKDAEALEDAGCFLLLLEAMPALLAKTISERCKLLTVSIGSGPHCDVITIVFHDFAGFNLKVPKFAKKYCDINSLLLDAMKKYKEEAETGRYPSEEHCYSWPEAQQNEFLNHFFPQGNDG